MRRCCRLAVAVIWPQVLAVMLGVATAEWEARRRIGSGRCRGRRFGVGDASRHRHWLSASRTAPVEGRERRFRPAPDCVIASILPAVASVGGDQRDEIFNFEEVQRSSFGRWPREAWGCRCGRRRWWRRGSPWMPFGRRRRCRCDRRGCLLGLLRRGADEAGVAILAEAAVAVANAAVVGEETCAPLGGFDGLVVFSFGAATVVEPDVDEHGGDTDGHQGDHGDDLFAGVLAAHALGVVSRNTWTERAERWWPMRCVIHHV